jgi:hypothetical protein
MHTWKHYKKNKNHVEVVTLASDQAFSNVSSTV